MFAILWLTLLTVSAPAHKITWEQVVFVPTEIAWSLSLEREQEVTRVHRAMEMVAESTWPRDLDQLMAKWGDGIDSRTVADAIVRASHQTGVDPLLLVSVAWKESHFKVRAKGDLRAGKPRSCGITQIRVDIRNRPTCDQMMDPYFALSWTAFFLKTFPRSDGRIDMTPYNGPKAARAFWALADTLAARLARENALQVAMLRSHSLMVE